VEEQDNCTSNGEQDEQDNHHCD